MYVVIVTGGIASGKSTVSHYLQERGATHIDLDEISRRVCEPGSPVLAEIAAAFGADLIDATSGELCRGELARRAFATPEATRRLEAIQHPAIFSALHERLEALRAREDMSAGGNSMSAEGDSISGEGASLQTLCIIEVALLDRALNLLPLVDEVLGVICPLEIRRVRAIARGMDGADFNQRVAQQTSDEFIRAHAHTVIENAGSTEELLSKVNAWCASRVKGEFSQGSCSQRADSWGTRDACEG